MPNVEVKAEGISCENPRDLSAIREQLLNLVSVPFGGACKKGDSYERGLKVTPSWGCAVKYTAGKVEGKSPVEVTLSVSTQQIPDALDIALSC